MIGASKILTVSYGTFSCTLEGFDDPFNTMKAIAEYFRDLAAEDRYFGAEPPTPDAAMLHRIAEREIQRRVEAKIQENGVILRAADTMAAAPAAISAPATVEPPTAPVAAAPAPEPAVAPETAEPEVAMPEAATAQAESVAAKLSRIRKAVAEAKAPAAPVAAAEPETAEYFEDEAAEDMEALAAAAEPETAEEAALALSDPDMADTAELRVDLTEDAGDDFASPEPEADFAAEDALLANLVSLDVTADQSLAAPETDGEAGADEAPQAVAVAGSADSDDSFAEAEEAPPAVAEADEAETGEADELDGLLARLNTPAEPASNLADSLDDDDFSADDEGEWAPETAEVELDTDEDEGPGTASGLIQRARARVIRIRRTTPQPVEDVEDEAPAAEVAAEPALSPEAEADLLRELAEVEAETRAEPVVMAAEAPAAPQEAVAEPVAEAPVAPQEAAPVRPTRPVRPVRPAATAPRAALPESAAEGEAAMSRLIAETNNQMQGAENRRRLSAIAHLKAAVAATVAERRAGAAKPVNDAERQDPYREDLSRIMRPATPAARTENAPRPSPLVLVSEQRIDRAPMAEPAPRPAEVGPIRPRRVAGAAAHALLAEDDELEDEDNLFADSRGFADFAERLGAQDLGALLEAAAAYAACVEGRPQFTRPQIMRQVASLSEDETNLREDSLRSFGTLLRTGRIVKIRRGQYALAEDSHYLAEARKLVG